MTEEDEMNANMEAAQVLFAIAAEAPEHRVQAYRKMCLRYHPDKKRENHSYATFLFQKIQEMRHEQELF